MYSTTDAGNIAVWVFGMFLFTWLIGAPVGGMLIALLAIFVVSCILHK